MKFPSSPAPATGEAPGAPSREAAPERLGSRILARGGSQHSYTVRLAASDDDIRAAQSLRFLVFNLELNEGLDLSYDTLRDEDPFDEVCDHLIVETDSEVVGTYRLQTGTNAGCRRGYYSELEFDFAPFEPIRHETIELGRACVASEHRNLVVLGLLWRGIAHYARQRGCRYLIGCGSLTSQDEREGAALYAALAERHLAAGGLQTVPLPSHRCSIAERAEKAPKAPKLLAAYLSLGAKICGQPAIDREFKTIDFLTLLDLESLPASASRLIG